MFFLGFPQGGLHTFESASKETQKVRKCVAVKLAPAPLLNFQFQCICPCSYSLPWLSLDSHTSY